MKVRSSKVWCVCFLLLFKTIISGMDDEDDDDDDDDDEFDGDEGI